MSRNLHKYEELTPYEFDREKERASIIYAAAGPMEYHEECNALGIDPCKGYLWCLDAAEITGGIVFPLIPFAPSGNPLRNLEQLRERFALPHFCDYTSQPLIYPSVFSSGEVCRQLYMELLETFALELKFKMCVFFGSHGPAGKLIKDIVKEETAGDHSGNNVGHGSVAGDFHGMRVMAVGSLDYNLDLVNAYYAEHDIKRINHGGLWESSINYAINPEYFQPGLLDESKYPQHFGALKEEHFEGCVRPVKSEFRKFSADFARKIYRVTVERFAADVQKNYDELMNAGR